MLKQEASLDLMFRALADPTRREIIARLAGGEASVSELARPFDMSLPAVHQHLQVIAEAGLMSWSKEGRVRRCRLLPGHIANCWGAGAGWFRLIVDGDAGPTPRQRRERWGES